MTGAHSPADAVHAQEVHVPRRGRNGAEPRWKILYDAMVNLAPGEIMDYERMAAALDLPLDSRSKPLILQASRRAVAELESQARMVFQLVRGKGFQRVEAEGVMVLAARHQKRALDEIDAGASKVATVDLSTVDATTAALIRATGQAFARQQTVMTSLDVRQRRLATALDALGQTVDHNANRLAALEDRVNAIAGGTPQSPSPTPAAPAHLRAQHWTQPSVVQGDPVTPAPPAEPGHVQHVAPPPTSAFRTPTAETAQMLYPTPPPSGNPQ